MTGHPNHRPVLIDFAYLLTKNLSLLVCGDIVTNAASHRYRNYLHKQAADWCNLHKIKAFYSLVDGEDFESGSRALMQVIVY